MYIVNILDEISWKYIAHNEQSSWVLIKGLTKQTW